MQACAPALLDVAEEWDSTAVQTDTLESKFQQFLL
jgi:hypothetical protein